MMRYLIDTQSFIWFVEDDVKLPVSIRTVMENSDNELMVSIASFWEMTIKMSLGKLVLSGDIASMLHQVRYNGFTILPIEGNHLITLSTLKLIHRDPFDRIIIAQALTANMPVISSDDIFGDYPIKWVWKNQ